jgi:hypothetical protein
MSKDYAIFFPGFNGKRCLLFRLIWKKLKEFHGFSPRGRRSAKVQNFRFLVMVFTGLVLKAPYDRSPEKIDTSTS